MIYDQIKNVLKAVTWIKWVDIDNGKLDDSEKRKSLKYPCSLIQESSQFSDITEDGKLQQENTSLQIRLSWDSTGSRTNANAPDTVQERSLNYTSQVKEVYDLLQSLIVADYDPMECVSGNQEPRKDGITIYRFNFKTSRIIEK